MSSNIRPCFLCTHHGDAHIERVGFQIQCQEGYAGMRSLDGVILSFRTRSAAVCVPRMETSTIVWPTFVREVILRMGNPGSSDNPMQPELWFASEPPPRRTRPFSPGLRVCKLMSGRLRRQLNHKGGIQHSPAKPVRSRFTNTHLCSSWESKVGRCRSLDADVLSAPERLKSGVGTDINLKSPTVPYGLNI